MNINDIFQQPPPQIHAEVKGANIQEQEDAPYRDPLLSVAQNLERESRTVFVGNVPINADKRALLKLFKPIGKIEKLWVRSVPVDIESKIPTKGKVILKQYVVNATNKNCYILFSSVKEAQAAILQVNRTNFEGRHLHVTPARTIERDYKTTAFVGNLPYEADEEELRAVFADCGEIDFIRLVRDHQSFRCQGIGYVKFVTKEGLDASLALHGAQFKGRPLRVSKAKKHNVTNREVPKNNLKVHPHVPKTEEERQEEARQVARLSRAGDADRQNYDVAQMENVFKHQGRVPNVRVKKSIKKLKKQNLPADRVVQRTTKIMANAQQKLNKEYFEKDNLLKERREQRKKKKKFNAAAHKKTFKGQVNK